LINRSPASFGLSNVVDAVCATALPNCTTATLVTGGDAALYLWADATRLSPAGQGQIAVLALDRAQRNPF
jgi:outer membrane lipase/esterase